MPSESRQESPSTSPSARDYLEHAKEVNRFAGGQLQLDRPQPERQVNGITLKISIGLSLQAIELAGKSMLRSLGYSPAEIRRTHGSHNLPTLLDAIQIEATGRGTEMLEPFQDFLCTLIHIEGQEFGTTIGAYLDDHFASGPSALPRSYFYPDEPVFMAPTPYSALYEIAERIIGFASQLEIVMMPEGGGSSA